MSENQEERQKRIEEIMAPLKGKDGREIVLALGKGAISAIPYAGGIIAELIGVVEPDFRLKRLRRFVAELAYDLEKIRTEINSEYVQKEECAHIFQRTFRGVADNYQKEKLDALKAILLNSCLRTDTDEELKQYLLSTALELGTLHIRLVSILRDPTGFYLKHNIKDQRDSVGMGGSMIESLRECLPDIPEGYIRSVWNDLYNRNLVNTEAKMLGAMVSNKGSRNFEGRLTELGKQLADYITNPAV